VGVWPPQINDEPTSANVFGSRKYLVDGKFRVDFGKSSEKMYYLLIMITGAQP
jgi:hypothetical protein